MQFIHMFDGDGFYSSSSERPLDPVRAAAAAVNDAVATLHPPPDFNPKTHRARWSGAGWSVEPALEPRQEPEPQMEPLQPQWPRFVGNQKLDLFAAAEQMAVVTATMQDPEVKLLYDRILGATYWSYEDPETEQGLAALVSKGLLPAARKAEIVAQMQPR